MTKAEGLDNLNTNYYSKNISSDNKVKIENCKELNIPMCKNTKPSNNGYEIEHQTIKFLIPKNAPEEAVDFANTLIKEKDKLMKELEIDSETYNTLAQTAIGIAGKETGFGRNLHHIIKTFFRDTLIKLDKQTLNLLEHHFSIGMTQLKFTLHIKDDSIKIHMDNIGIKESNELYNSKTSAIATIIVLSEMNKRLENCENFKNGFQQSQQKYGTTKQDALCKLWCGDPLLEIVNGTYNPKEWEYAKIVREYTQQYKLISEE